MGNRDLYSIGKVFFASTLALLVLSACGGGGSASTSPSGAQVLPMASEKSVSSSASTSPADMNFHWNFGPTKTVPAAVPASMDAGTRGNFPDAHFSVVQNINKNGYDMYWGIGNTWRSAGPDQYPQDQGNAQNVLATYGDSDANNPWRWASNGNWMLSVFRVGETNKLIGFPYGEDNSTPGQYNENTGVNYSNDDGKSWTTGTRLFAPDTGAASQPNFGPGNGNGIVTWDFLKQRWFAFIPESYNDSSGTYHQGMMMAESKDPLASPGTWHKYNNGAFTSPALGGPDSDSPVLGNWMLWNPSLFWDTYLNEWVCISDDIQGNLYITVSKNLDDWNSAPVLFMPKDANDWYQYATVIGVDDKTAGQTFTIYYANFGSSYPSNRSFHYRTVTLSR